MRTRLCGLVPTELCKKMSFELCGLMQTGLCIFVNPMYSHASGKMIARYINFVAGNLFVDIYYSFILQISLRWFRHSSENLVKRQTVQIYLLPRCALYATTWITGKVWITAFYDTKCYKKFKYPLIRDICSTKSPRHKAKPYMISVKSFDMLPSC